MSKQSVRRLLTLTQRVPMRKDRPHKSIASTSCRERILLPDLRIQHETRAEKWLVFTLSWQSSITVVTSPTKSAPVYARKMPSHCALFWTSGS